MVRPGDRLPIRHRWRVWAGDGREVASGGDARLDRAHGDAERVLRALPGGTAEVGVYIERAGVWRGGPFLHGRWDADGQVRWYAAHAGRGRAGRGPADGRAGPGGGRTGNGGPVAR